MIKTVVSKSILRKGSKIILSNKCKCTICGDIIESKTVHDFVECSCGNIFTDGGKEYVHRGAIDPSKMEDMSECMEVDLTK